jgi:hypothetical protein
MCFSALLSVRYVRTSTSDIMMSWVIKSLIMPVCYNWCGRMIFCFSWASDSPGTEVPTEAVASITQGPPPHYLTLSSSAGLKLWTGWAREGPYFRASHWHWQDGESVIADVRQVNAVWGSHGSKCEDNLLNVTLCSLVDKHQHAWGICYFHHLLWWWS